MKKGQTENNLTMVEKVTNYMKSLRIFPFSCSPILSFSLFLIIPFTHFPILSDAWAATYYVDAKNGNDANAGIQSQPWRTLSKAANSLNPGDSVVVKEGTYREQLTPKNSGTSKAFILYQADIGRNVVINGSEPISNWTLGSATTYRTQISWSCKQAFQDGQRLIRKQAKANLIAGSWYQDPFTLTLYIITTDNTSPSLHTIEVSKRDYGIYLHQRSKIKIEGFTVKRTNGIGAICLTRNSNGNQIVNCNISLSYGTGILIEDTSNNNSVISNKVSFSHYNEGTSQFFSSNGVMVRSGSSRNYISTNKFFSNYGSGIFIYKSSNNIVEMNKVYENGAGGIDVNDQESNSNLVRYNIIYRNGQIDTDEQGISFFNSGSGNIARGNTVYGQKGGPNDGVGIAIDTTPNEVIIEQNIVYNNSGHGLSIWNSKNGVLRNNTSYGNLKNGVFVGGKGSPGAQVVNNIASNNVAYQLSFQPDAVAAGGYLISHNNFYKPGYQKVVMFNDKTYTATEFNTTYPGSNILQVEPLFVSPVNDFRLSPTSPCIDQGQDVGLSFTGQAPDLGAHEYGTNPKTLTPPTNLRITPK